MKPGEYPGQIIQVQVKFSKCGNYEQHALRVRVEDAANEHWEDFWERLTFSDTAMWKVEQALGAVRLDAGAEREIQPEDWLESMRPGILHLPLIFGRRQCCGHAACTPHAAPPQRT